MSATVALMPEKVHKKKYLVAWDIWGCSCPCSHVTTIVGAVSEIDESARASVFPLLIAIALYFPIRHLMSEEGQVEKDITRGRLRWTMGIFALSIIVFSASAWLFSPWLAHVAALALFLAWALGRCTNVPWSTPAAWTGFCCDAAVTVRSR